MKLLSDGENKKRIYKDIILLIFSKIQNVTVKMQESGNTGGYNLQIAFSTARLASESIVSKTKN
jgi:hypothetical protein